MDYPGQNLIFTLNVPASDGTDGTATDVSTVVGAMTVEVAGSFSGQYIILGSHDGTNYVPLATFQGGGDVQQTIAFFPHLSAQAGGPFNEPAGIPTHFVKVRRRSPDGGVSITLGAGKSLTLNNFVAMATVAPGSTGLQAIVDLFALVPPTGFFPGFSVFCTGAFDGGDILLEGSMNGVNFGPIAQFRSPGPGPLSAVTAFPIVVIQQVIRYVRLNIRANVTANTFITLGGSVAADSALGVVSLTAGPGILLTGTAANPIVNTTAGVANIAALKLVPVATVREGQPIWVATKKAGYEYDPLAATVAGDDNFYVAPAAGPGMYTRILAPVPEWQAAATNGTGIFLDSTAGNDENVGDAGTPIKTMREFNSRMWGAEFATVSPLLRIAGTGSVTAQDGTITGFRCQQSATLLIMGVETVLTAGVVLSAAADLNPAVGTGFISSVATDFSASISNTVRSVWARRADAAGGQTTYAALKRSSGAGPFTANISPQVKQNLATWSIPATATQAFAAADVIDLVTFPVWPKWQVDMAINFAYGHIDTANGATFEGFGQGRIIGTRGLLTQASQGSSFTVFGGQFSGEYSSGPGSFSNFRSFNFGAQGLVVANMTVLGAVLISRFTMDNASLTVLPGTTVGIGNLEIGGATGGSWVENLTTPIVGTNKARVTIDPAHTMGIGPAVVNGASMIQGAQMTGATRLSTALNAFTSATPWTIGTIGAVATAALGIFDMDSLSAITLS